MRDAVPARSRGKVRAPCYSATETRVDLPTIQAIANEAIADYRTVIREIRAQIGLDDRPVRGAVGGRIRVALALRGLPSIDARGQRLTAP